MRAKGNKWLIQILFILVIVVILKLAFLYYDGVKNGVKTNKEDPNKTVLNKAVEEIENETNGNVEYKEEDEDKKENEEEKTVEKTDKNKNCDRWIVITSISDPTEHVKYVQDALFEWCLVVVGDSKSPPNWNYKDAIFLSLQDQIDLGGRYSIVEEIPTKSYLRKMVGYLYAIDHGAKYIYETDDDNSALDGLLGFKYMRYRGLEMDCQAENMFVNPYAYFGQPSAWPRGYPLEMISETAVSANCSKFTVSTKMPLIQQGLVNGDPDVDAIYRLTRKQPSKLLYIEFDGNAPSLLLKNRQYAPTNSQNTFFHYDSFWTLIFPRNVTFREVDILRGYIGIRMLQEIDGRVAYLSPNAVQIRNAHSYHKDYLQETRLYESIQRFVVDLDQWTCDKDELKECFIDCIQMLVDKKHLCKSEVDFFRLWIKDLDSIGYKWPKINSNRAKNFIQKKLNLPITAYFKALEQDHSSNSNDNEKSIVQRQSQETKIAKIKSMCQFSADKSIDLDKINKISDIILVTWIKSEEDLDLISNVLNVHFSFIIGCFPSKIEKLLNINDYIMSNTSGGITLIDATSFQKCAFNAVNIGFKQNTFIFVKSINKFEFWSNTTKLIDSSDKINFFELDNNPKIEELFDKNVYFVRKTVANGQKILDLGTSSSTSFNLNSYCSIYSSELYNSIVKSFKETVQTLNWHSNDLVGESCSNIDSRTIWIPDFHDGPRVDISSTLAHLGQTPILAGSKGSSSVYPNALMLSKISSQLSNYVKNYNAESNRKLSESSVRENFEFYKASSDFNNVDSIICSFTAVFCEAFIPLNKTIIFNPAHRYNIGRCNKDSWTRLNENYNKLKARSKLVVSAMSKYDEEYQAHFTGLRGYKLYAHGTFYGKNIEYNPVKKEILVGPIHGFGADGEKWFQEIQNLSKDSQLIFRKIREVYPHYELSDLAKHPAIVIFPYSVMSYSIIDFYLSNIPIFVPSIEILTKSKSLYDRSIYFEAYCGKIEPIQPCSTSKHLPFDPNSNEDADYSYWLQFSDYYRWPHVTVFNSWSDLFKKLQTVDLKQISNSMREFNKVRQAYVLDNWCRIIKSLPKEQPIPKSLEEALSYFNMTTVQTY